jgi:flagellar motility protein MotE (MotC chaperone)
VIVTRQRRRRLNLRRFMLPALAIVALAVALLWPPSHNAIANGPLKPVWQVGERTAVALGAPLRFAAQQQTITDRNREIRTLNGQLEQQRAKTVAGEQKVQALQQQVTALANQPKPTPVPAVRPTAMSANAAVNAQGAGAASAVSEGDRRVAATWAAMEPEKAAAVAQRLPDDQVVRILGAMDADQAGEIMNALPAAVAARLSRAAPQVGAAAVR